MPALMEVPSNALIAARQYVTDFCIKTRRRNEKSVHNLAFYLYAEQQNGTDLIKYLDEEETKKNNGLPIIFEVEYALNICK